MFSGLSTNIDSIMAENLAMKYKLTGLETVVGDLKAIVEKRFNEWEELLQKLQQQPPI